ncbi:gp53-like domain-containing protein, partial [Lonsdalea iberica]|uniref:gp53-like domain-containing protein n=1 Tax=Lonsdalea iberica TaxID=1082703 RepID=UPI003F62E618
LVKAGIATGSLATPGYAILPLIISGVKKNLIVQWGTLRMTSIVVNSFNRQKFTFPVTFPTAIMALSSSVRTGIAPALFASSSFENATQTGAEWIYATAQEGLVPIVSYIAVGY